MNSTITFDSVDMLATKFASDYSATTNHTTKTEDCDSTETDLQSSFASFQFELGKKQVRFATDREGNEKCAIHIVESYQKYPELWWSADQLQQIKKDCQEIALKYRENEQFCEAITNMLLHGVHCTDSTGDWKNFMDTMSTHHRARGLEPHIVTSCRKLAEIHYDAVFDAQQEAYDNGLYGTDKGDWAVCKASCETSRPFDILAFRQAQFDTREAMRAAFSRWTSERQLKGTRKPRLSRRASCSARCLYS